MIKKILITLAVAFMLIPFTANAGMEKGDHEISFSGTVLSGGGIKLVTVYGSYGLMIEENIQIKGVAILTDSNFGSSGFIGVGGEYFFSEDLLGLEDIVPYAGGNLTFGVGSGAGVTFLDAHVGAKDYVSESTALFLEAGLRTDTSNFLSENTFLITAGVSVTFGK